MLQAPAESDSRLQAVLESIVERLEDPVVLVRDDRMVLFCNEAAKRVLSSRHGMGLRNGRLIFGDSAADRSLMQRLAAGFENPAEQFPHATKLPRRSGTRDWYCMAIPMKLAASDRSLVLLHLVGRVRPRRVSPRVLKDLFGLTHRDTMLLGHLVKGLSPREIAAAMSLSHETIRAYLKRIYRKCDLGSQAELLSLLQKVSLFT